MGVDLAEVELPRQQKDVVGRRELVGTVERTGRGRCRDCGTSGQSGRAGFPYLSPFPGGIPCGRVALPVTANASARVGVCPFLGLVFVCSRASPLLRGVWLVAAGG